MNNCARLAAAASRGEAETIAVLQRELGEARQELRELGQGLRPAALTEGGLEPTVLFLEADEATLLDRFK